MSDVDVDAARKKIMEAQEVLSPLFGSATYTVAGKGQIRVLMGKQEYDFARDAGLKLSQAIELITKHFRERP